MKKLMILIAAMTTFSSTAFAQLGSLATDLVYTPVTPCRVFDTRPSQGGTGPITADGTKNFTIWGASSYAGQGGAASNCGITAGSNTAAVALNVTVVTPAAGGFVVAYPYGTARPTSATVNFQTGDIARGNFTIAKVTQNSSYDLTVYSTSNADVVGDVVGYFSKPISAGSLECVTTSESSQAMNSGPINGRYFGYTGAPSCTTGYVSTSTICRASSVVSSIAAVSGDTCFGNHADATQTIHASQRCCRIPGR